MRCPNRTICCELFVRKGERESMRDYKKAVLGMTLALSMVVTGSSLDGITASAAAKSSKKATVKLSSGKLILKAGAKKTLKLKKKNVKKIKSMKWTSSKKSVAAVSKKGKITATIT